VRARLSSFDGVSLSLSLSLAVEFLLFSLRDLQTFSHIESSISAEELIGSIEVVLKKP
jgi:hypothetical protein